MTVSVLTIVYGRRAHLINLIEGLSRQSVVPHELIIAVMHEHPFEGLPETPFPVHQLLIPDQTLPLGRARNAAAAKASGTGLIFLDVDCIPGPTLVEDYSRFLAAVDGLVMGEVLYLPANAVEDHWSYEALDVIGEKHCDRRGPPAKIDLEICNDYRCFWSLNFAMRTTTYAAIGGFDERYTGYGGEDTDFGRCVEAAGVPIYWCRGARAYHQHHRHHMPPVHHLHSVLANSRAFRDKWGHFTMEHWLYAFELMGLIENTGDDYRILREPDEDDLALTKQYGGQPYASSAWVVRDLKARVAAEQAAPPQAAALIASA